MTLADALTLIQHIKEWDDEVTPILHEVGRSHGRYDVVVYHWRTQEPPLYVTSLHDYKQQTIGADWKGYPPLGKKETPHA